MSARLYFTSDRAGCLEEDSDAGIDFAKTEKARAQKILSNILSSALPSVGVKNVGFPGGNDDVALFTKGSGHLWFGGKTLEDASIPRYWNALGIYDEAKSAQTPTVELNIPIHDNSARVSGFLARDPATGTIYLMHTGKIGGGAKGSANQPSLPGAAVRLFLF